MTSWPILERELRVWARRRVTYWGRFSVAAGGILVCATPLLWTGPFLAPAATGRYAFDGLVSAAFLLSCMACLLTADAVSGERREGTLGLLMLTRMKHLDLLLGKLASSGLASVLGLVALMPLLSLPLLVGGVTGGEAVRKAAVLLDTVFMALSIGLWASANGVERFRTAWTALLLVTALVIGPSLLGLVWPTPVPLASPLTAITRAADLAYRAAPDRYWLSLSFVHAIGWAFLLAARFRLSRHNDQTGEPIDGSAAQPFTVKLNAASSPVPADLQPTSSACGEPSEITCSYCGRLNNADATFCNECGTELRPKPVERTGSWTLSTAPTPLHWLLARQRGLKPLIWVAASVGFLRLTIFDLLQRFFGLGMGTSFLGIFPFLGLAEATIEGSLFAWVASRFLVEARRTGELELLLTTPLGSEQLVSTQWETLKGLARLPVLLMAALPLILQALFAISGPNALWKAYYVLPLLLNTANTILSVGALLWLAPWLGLQVVGQGRVIFWTVLLVKGLPFLAGTAWSLACRFVLRSVGPPAGTWSGSFWLIGFLVPQAVTFVLYLWLIRAARYQLLHLAGTEPLDVYQLGFRALVRIAGLVRRAQTWRAA